MNLRTPDCVIRPLQPQDLSALAELCAEHARYERDRFDAADKEADWAHALFAPTPRLRAWIADAAGQALGYATATVEYSTWQARDYLHLDCLYVREHARGSGIGAALFDTVVDFARGRGYAQMQWQTPDWNVDACRFYRRHGGVGRNKVRFVLALVREEG